MALRTSVLTLAFSCLWLSLPACAQAGTSAKNPPSSNQTLNLDVMSDTGGVDISPYVRHLIGDVREQWIAAMGTTVNGFGTTGEAVVRFKILPSGRIGAMWLDSSTHNDAFNRAAWHAITSTTYDPPPSGLKDPNLMLRLHFVAN